MDVWWLAIDKKYTSYEELKHRKVVAQGWALVGNLLTLCPLVPSSSPTAKSAFQSTIFELEPTPTERQKASDVLWNLLSLKANDLIVGIEGTDVRGICQLEKNGWESYQYHSPEAYEYVQTIGFPVEWIDWDVSVFGFKPVAPGQSVPGIAGLQNDRKKAIDAWNKRAS